VKAINGDGFDFEEIQDENWFCSKIEMDVVVGLGGSLRNFCFLSFSFREISKASSFSLVHRTLFLMEV